MFENARKSWVVLAVALLVSTKAWGRLGVRAPLVLQQDFRFDSFVLL